MLRYFGFQRYLFGLDERLGAESVLMQTSFDQCIENIDKDARHKDTSQFKELASDWQGKKI